MKSRFHLFHARRARPSSFSRWTMWSRSGVGLNRSRFQPSSAPGKIPQNRLRPWTLKGTSFRFQPEFETRSEAVEQVFGNLGTDPDYRFRIESRTLRKLQRLRVIPDNQPKFLEIWSCRRPDNPSFEKYWGKNLPFSC